MQVLQAGRHKLLLLELDPEFIENIARQAGFEFKLEDQERRVLDALSSERGHQRAAELADAIAPRCQRAIPSDHGKEAITHALVDRHEATNNDREDRNRQGVLPDPEFQSHIQIYGASSASFLFLPARPSSRTPFHRSGDQINSQATCRWCRSRLLLQKSPEVRLKTPCRLDLEPCVDGVPFPRRPQFSRATLRICGVERHAASGLGAGRGNQTNPQVGIA